MSRNGFARYCIQCGREITDGLACAGPDCGGLPSFYRHVPGPDPAAARCNRAGVLVPWPQGNEVERLLALMQALGYPCTDRSLAFPLRPLDHASWRLLAAGSLAAD